jgi:hypothetical protein
LQPSPINSAAPPQTGQSGEARKRFFFEKKKQKTFFTLGPGVVSMAWHLTDRSGGGGRKAVDAGIRRHDDMGR